MVEKVLIDFIIEAKNRGFKESEIRAPLLQKGWSKIQIQNAFDYVKERYSPKHKDRITIFLDHQVLQIIKKRAKRNLLSIEEQIENIVHKSALAGKKLKAPEQNIDDLLVSIFSRRRYSKK